MENKGTYPKFRLYCMGEVRFDENQNNTNNKIKPCTHAT